MKAEKDIKTGKWLIQYRYTDWQGNRKKSTKRGFDTKREAEQWYREFSAKKQQSVNMLFSDFVEIYLKDMETRLREHTMIGKRYAIEQKIIPYFGKRRLSDIKAVDIRKWQNELMKKDYAPTYLRAIQNQLNAIFNYAIKYYDLPSNPCLKAGSMGKKHADEMQFWTKEEYDRFISGIEVGSRYYVIFEILFWTGCREGEMLALTKSDIDFTENRISISKTYYRTERKDVITTPKTEQSVRVIDIPQFLTQEIRDYVDKLYELPDDERIFPIVAEAVQHKLKHNCEKTGVKKIRVHDIRRSHVAYLINQGVQPLIIKERLGHRDIKITLNTYGHLYPNQQRQVADMLNQQRTEKVPTAATVRT